MQKFWVSVTGLMVKSWWQYPAFMKHAMSLDAAGSAGNVHTSFKQVGGMHHTLTVWNTRQDMLAFMRSGNHVEAMKAGSSFTEYGVVYGYENDAIPSWEEALGLLEEKGRVIYGQAKASKTEVVSVK